MGRLGICNVHFSVLTTPPTSQARATHFLPHRRPPGCVCHHRCPSLLSLADAWLCSGLTLRQLPALGPSPDRSLRVTVSQQRD